MYKNYNNLYGQSRAETAIGNISDAQLEHIAEQLHGFTVKPSGTEGYRTAEVTLGGIDTTEISSKHSKAKAERTILYWRST